ncbi:MAG: hypothetical protein V3S85_01780, partial [Nitrospirales bacterium]
EPSVTPAIILPSVIKKSVVEKTGMLTFLTTLSFPQKRACLSQSRRRQESRPPLVFLDASPRFHEGRLCAGMTNGLRALSR